MKPPPVRVASNENFNLSGLYHSKSGKNSGGRIEYDKGLYRVWSKPCPQEVVVETFGITSEGGLTYCADEQSLAILVVLKGVELSTGDLFTPSLLFLELSDDRTAQRFKDGIIEAAKHRTAVKLSIESTEIQYFNALTAPYRHIVTTTGEIERLRAELEKVRSAKARLHERYQETQGKLSASLDPRQHRTKLHDKQIAGVAPPFGIVPAQQKSHIKSKIVQVRPGEQPTILQPNDKLSTAEASNKGYLDRIESLEMQLAAAQTKLAERADYTKSLEVETSSMQNKIVQDSKRIKELTSSPNPEETATSLQRVKTLEFQLQSANDMNLDLLRNVSSLEQQRDEYKAKRNTVRDVAEKLKVSAGQLKTSNEQKAEEIERLRSENKNLKAMTLAMQDESIESVREEVQRLEGVANDKDELIAFATSENDNLKATVRNLQSENEQKNREIDSLKEKVADGQTSKSRRDQFLSSQTTSLQATVTALRSESKQKEQAIERLEASIEVLKNEGLSKDDRIQSLQNQVVSLDTSMMDRNAQNRTSLIAAFEGVKKSKEQKVKQMEDAIDDEDVPLVMRKCLL